MTVPENTTNRDSLLHLAGLVLEGQSNYIENMEAEGQRQLVDSDRIPVEGPADALIELGFTLGDVDPADPLFRSCTLPEGWTRAATEHAMNSTINDERGVERIEVFYKAAFYDRKASFYPIVVGRYLANRAVYSDGPVALPAVWSRFNEEERADFWARVSEMEERAARDPDIWGDCGERCAALRALDPDAPETA